LARPPPCPSERTRRSGDATSRDLRVEPCVGNGMEKLEVLHGSLGDAHFAGPFRLMRRRLDAAVWGSGISKMTSLAFFAPWGARTCRVWDGRLRSRWPFGVDDDWVRVSGPLTNTTNTPNGQHRGFCCAQGPRLQSAMDALGTQMAFLISGIYTCILPNADCPSATHN